MTEEIQQLPVLSDAIKSKLDAALGKLEEAAAAAPEADVLPELGKDIDLDKWMVDEAVQHLYARAKRVKNQYVVEAVEWRSDVKNYGGDPMAADPKTNEYKNLGAHITAVTMGPEGWALFNVLPNGSGLGCAIFRRQFLMPLPDPLPVGKAPGIEDLDPVGLAARTEAWAKENNAPEVAN